MRAPAKPRNLLRGVVLLCRGRVEGFDEIGGGVQDFLSSLAPMIAFPLVGSLLMLSRGLPRDAATDFLATLCAVLAPPVISHTLASYWRREAMWAHFATAFNWCQWMLPLIAAVLLLIGAALLHAGAPIAVLGLIGLLLLAGYALWLHWFLARHGLGLPPGRSAVLVIVVNLGTMILAVGPQLAQRFLFGGAG
jgi:hypothetical protein